MLEDCLIEAPRLSRPRKSITAMLAMLVHGGIVTVLLVAPLLQAHVLPRVDGVMRLIAPPASGSPPVVTRSVPTVSAAVPTGSPLIAGELIEPVAIPPRLVAVVDELPAESVAMSSFAGTASIARLFTVQPERAAEAALPLPPAIPAATSVATLRLGGSVQAARLMRQVKPEYPRMARDYRVHGVVVLEATITAEGAVDSLRVVSGHPFLVAAAVEAVRQWQYQPTLLNGEPVPVITTITLSFTMN